MTEVNPNDQLAAPSSEQPNVESTAHAPEQSAPKPAAQPSPRPSRRPTTRPNRFTPLYVAIGIVAGILIGSFYANHFLGNRLNIIGTGGDKLNSLLHIIDDQYVDTVDINNLVEESLPEILKKLDPHSVYIPASEADASMQDLRGSFSGIGVQFMIYKDTVRVVKVLAGGPSEGAGLQPGDRIVKIDGETYVGKDINNDDVRTRLKGESGTTVKVGIKRAGVKGIKEYDIARGDVPLQTIDAAYMLNNTTGYIRITSFGDTTYPEFLAALATLGDDGLKNLVIDLRGNLGGYMQPAVQIANEFLPADRLIVYTKGRKSPREEYTSDGLGSYQNMPLVVLVDESSASASEIFAGAIQDNDRGTIIGRRTFGKGLVQIPIEFSDGSMLRLTKARYYTPAGRCVQKPYTPGDEEDYEQDLILRAEHGEYYSQDSIKTSGEKFRTRLGRVVYGGGGIIPDVFIARDTTGINSYFKDVYLEGLISSFAYDFTDRHRAKLTAMDDYKDIVKFVAKENIVERFAAFAEQNGVKRRNLMIRECASLLKNYITTAVIDDILDVEAASAYANETDPAVLRAIEVFKAGKSFPTAQSTTSASPRPLATRTALPSTWQALVRSTVSSFRSFQHWLTPLHVAHPNFAICPAKQSMRKKRCGHA